MISSMRKRKLKWSALVWHRWSAFPCKCECDVQETAEEKCTLARFNKHIDLMTSDQKAMASSLVLQIFN